MRIDHLKLVLVCGTALLWAGAAHAANVIRVKDGGRYRNITVYKKHETPRNVTHRAYPLQADRNGKTWLFDRAQRKAMQADFAAYSKEKLPGYEGRVIDCANVALDNLLNYGKDRGLRLTLKFYYYKDRNNKGWRYLDTAQFHNFDSMKKYVLDNFGAGHVTDACEVVRPGRRLTTPESFGVLKPGDLIMSTWRKPHSQQPGKAGGRLRPELGHTQPIMEVTVGQSLPLTRIKVMNGDYNVRERRAEPAHSSTIGATDLKPVAGPHTLSSGVRAFKAMQVYDSANPIGPGEGFQPSQGPMRWRIFK